MTSRTKPSLSRLARAYLRSTEPLIVKASPSFRAPAERDKRALEAELDRLDALPSHRGTKRKQSQFLSELRVSPAAALLRFELAARKHGLLKDVAPELGLSVFALYKVIESEPTLSDLVAKLRIEGALHGGRVR